MRGEVDRELRGEGGGEEDLRARPVFFGRREREREREEREREREDPRDRAA